jgi:hypothetical protein
MRYVDNQFEWPILWRIGDGPRALRSLDEAIEAIDLRLEEIEGRLVYSDEVSSLLQLRDVVEAATASLAASDIDRAVNALRSFAATYRPMVALPEGESLESLFAWLDSGARPRRWNGDEADG